MPKPPPETNLEQALLPVSLHENPDELGRMARFLTHFGTTTLRLCHVLPLDSTREAEQNALDRMQSLSRRMIEEGFNTHYHVARGVLSEEVNRVGRQFECQIIALRWQHKSLIRRTLLDSSDTELLKRTVFPTLIYKPPASGTESLRTILYATDLQETDTRITPYIEAAGRNSEKLYLLHVRQRAPDPKTDVELLEDIENRLYRLGSRFQDHYSSIEPLIIVGSERSRIPRKAKKYGADLIIAGKRSRRKAREKLLGSTAETIAHNAKSSLLIIPPEEPI